ncbi:Mariner Mos1 transposase [Eumeta japonica]|uniref:Mariner Mos1 transposase n=1 Tax=Eumeta variegata TaxID=151549 RepID=A0A4C1WU77_EUMVA|nr:Mariner Mos1 transposase [Eumeta japonica]
MLTLTEFFPHASDPIAVEIWKLLITELQNREHLFQIEAYRKVKSVGSRLSRSGSGGAPAPRAEKRPAATDNNNTTPWKKARAPGPPPALQSRPPDRLHRLQQDDATTRQEQWCGGTGGAAVAGGRRPCSMTCAGAAGAVPSLACAACLCLYHPHCQGLSHDYSLPPARDFLCKYAELEEDSSQTQKELALTLEVTQQAVSHHLKSLGMINKQSNWVPYELKPRDVERQLCMSEMLLTRHKKARSCMRPRALDDLATSPEAARAQYKGQFDQTSTL